MAIDNKRLESFFSKRKIGNISSLKNPKKRIKNNQEQTGSNQLANGEQTESKLLAISEQSVSKGIANQEQTGSNQLANGEQTESKRLAISEQSVSKSIANQEQMGSNQLANGEQIESKRLAISEQSVSKSIARQEKKGSNQLANGEQTESKRLANSEQSVSKGIAKQEQTGSNQLANGEQIDTVFFTIGDLSGIQYSIIILLHSKILDKRNRITEKLNISTIRDNIERSEGVIKNAILRLKNKKCLSISKQKQGRGGWCQYQIEKTLFDSLPTTYSSIYNSNTITTNINKYKAQDDQHRDNETDKDKIIAELQKQLELQNQKKPQSTHQPQATVSTSKKEQLTAYLNNHLSDIDANTTKTNPVIQDNHEAWQKIDFSALAPYGFKKSHIKQIMDFNTGLTPQEVEDSIEHYAWALENRREEIKSYAPKNNPLRGLMGVLKNGNAWIEGSYQSPEELALELQIQAKRTQLERQQAKRDELFNIEFEMWYTELSSENIKKIEATNQFKSLPIATFKKGMGSEMYGNMMKGYYRDKIVK